MPKIKPGDTVTIEATVSRVSDDGAEVTVRLPHYGYPVTLPQNSVVVKPGASLHGYEEGEAKAPPLPKRRRSKLSKILGDE